jgi:hypothetical protein
MISKKIILFLFISIPLLGKNTEILYADRYPLEIFSYECGEELYSSANADRENSNLFPAATILLASCKSFNGDIDAYDVLMELGNHKTLISDIKNIQNKQWLFEVILLASSNIINSHNDLDNSFQSREYIEIHLDDWFEIAEELDRWESLVLSIYMSGEFNLYKSNIVTALEFYDLAELLYLEKVDPDSEYMGAQALMTSFLRIKVSKFQALYFTGNIEALLSEARSINFLLALNNDPFDSLLHPHFLDALEIFWIQDSRLKEYQIFKTLEENLLLALIRDTSAQFEASFLEHLSLFFINRAVNGIETSFCKNTNFTKLINDPRADLAIQNYLDFMCNPSSEKYNSLITDLDKKLSLPMHQDAFVSLIDCVSNLDFDCLNEYSNIDYQVLYGLILLMADNSLIIEGGLDNNDLSLERDIFDFYSYSIDVPDSIDFYNINQFVNKVRFLSSGSDNPREALELVLKSDLQVPDRDTLNKFFQDASNIEEFLAFNNPIFQSYATIFNFTSFAQKDDLINGMKERYNSMLKEFRDYQLNLSLTIISHINKNIFLNRIESDYVVNYIKKLLHQSLEMSYQYAIFNSEFLEDHENHIKNVLDTLFFIEETPASQAIKLKYAQDQINDQEIIKAIQDYRNLLIQSIQSSNLVITASNMNAESLQEVSSFRNILNKEIKLSNQKLNLAFASNKEYLEDAFKFSGLEQAQKEIGETEGLIYLFTIPGSESIFTLTIYNDMVFSSYQLNFPQYESNHDPFIKLSKIISDPFAKDKKDYIDEFSSYFFRDIFTLFEKNWIDDFPEYGNISNVKQVSKYYFVQDGPFSSIPFHALRYKGKYIIENFEVSYLPNLSSYFYLKPFQKLNKFIGFGNPNLQTNNQIELKKRGIKSIKDLAPLQETKGEIDFISKKFKFAQKFFGDDANEINFKSPEMDYTNSFVYFATHSVPFGTLISDEPGLVLSISDASKDLNNGILTISEIASHNFDNSIIGLSACKSFGTAYQGAKEYSGLAQAFFLGGANNVYSTMWDIESFSAVSFNQEVFKFMDMNSSDLSKSIQLSSLEFINGKNGDLYRDPYFWAPYINIGL